MPTHITVTAPLGKLTPIHDDDGRHPGGIPLRVSAQYVDRVRFSQSIRRSIARGDLIPCDMNGAACVVELAAAPEELPGGRIDLSVQMPRLVDRAAAEFSRVVAEQFTPGRGSALAEALSNLSPSKVTP